MPAGLDGNPDPLSTEQRAAVLATVAHSVQLRKTPGAPLLVAVDGIDGSGKSTFADELALVLRQSGESVIRASIDSFHNCQDVRWRRGPTSPVGFFYDSHDLDAVRTRLLDPLASGHGSYVAAVFDVEQDLPVAAEPETVDGDDILIFDGIFAHRSELAGYWHLSIYLDGQQRVDAKRLGYVLEGLPVDPIEVVQHVLEWQQRIERYSAGMRYYNDLVQPAEVADIVIDNNNFAAPSVVRSSTNG